MSEIEMFMDARTGLTVNINVNVSTKSIPRDNLTTDFEEPQTHN